MNRDQKAGVVAKIIAQRFQLKDVQVKFGQELRYMYPVSAGAAFQGTGADGRLYGYSAYVPWRGERSYTTALWKLLRHVATDPMEVYGAAETERSIE
jgi:hypothetical protein